LTSNLSAFNKDFLDGTTPHPLMPKFRLFHNVVVLEVYTFNGCIILGLVQSLEPRVGYGSAAVKWLCSLADEHQLEIKGTVRRLGKEGFNQRGLKRWYKSLGFHVSYNNTITRKPAQV
jgi:hypothetical protein